MRIEKHMKKLKKFKKEKNKMRKDKKTNDEINKAKENMVKIELLEQKAEFYIYDYFEDIKRQVDIRREKLKLEIDEYSDEIIKSLEINQQNLIKLSKDINKMTTIIEKSKNELNKLITQFEALNTNQKKIQ